MSKFIQQRGVLVLAGLFCLMATFSVLAGGHCACSHCGCETNCCKVCRLVEEEKKVTFTCWGGKCEDFCIPGPSQKCCEHCEQLCDKDPDGCPVCARKSSWTIWQPWACPTIHTKAKLMKKTITKKIPSYKWVVEDLCPKCEAKATSADPTPGVEVPPKPKAAGAKVAPTEAKY